jgi:hypothetical protein
VEERVRSGRVRRPSPARRIGGVGRGAQRRAQRPFLDAHPLHLRPLCRTSRVAGSLRGLAVLRGSGTPVEADGGDAARGAAVARLLAPGAPPPQSRPQAAGSGFVAPTAAREAAHVGARRGRECRDPGAAAHRRHGSPRGAELRAPARQRDPSRACRPGRSRSPPSSWRRSRSRSLGPRRRGPTPPWAGSGS